MQHAFLLVLGEHNCSGYHATKINNNPIKTEKSKKNVNIPKTQQRVKKKLHMKYTHDREHYLVSLNKMLPVTLKMYTYIHIPNTKKNAGNISSSLV